MSLFSSIKKRLKEWKFQSRCKSCNLAFPVLCKVHGVSRPSYQGALAQSRADDELQLVHVPTDKYPYNVYVYAISINRILGYLDEYLSRKLIYVFGEGFCLDGKITAVTGGNSRFNSAPLYFGCNIAVYATTSMMLPYLKELETDES